MWPGIDEPDRLSYSVLPESADEMHLLHSLSCTSERRLHLPKPPPAALHEVHYTQYVHMGYLQTAG
jgi:hypothetical protein